MKLTIQFSSTGKEIPSRVYHEASNYFTDDQVLTKQEIMSNYQVLFQQGLVNVDLKKPMTIIVNAITTNRKISDIFITLDFQNSSVSTQFKDLVEPFVDKILTLEEPIIPAHTIANIKVWYKDSMLRYFFSLPLEQLDEFFLIKLPNDSMIEVAYGPFGCTGDNLSSFDIFYSSEQEYQDLIEKIKTQIKKYYLVS